MQLSKRLAHIELSTISHVFALVRDLRAEGKEITDLCVGEPDFDTPEHIKAAAHRAALAGHTKYTVIDGSAELKAAICRKHQRENGVTFTPQEISVHAGAKAVLHTALCALVDPGDEVVLLTPAWGSYPEMLTMLEAKKVLVHGQADQGYKISPEQLRNALTPHTKAVIINSPSNPAGVTYTREELAAFAEVLRDFPNTWIISDEIYEHIIYDQQAFCAFLAAAPECRERTITINGVSKAYAMTGWRIGWAAAPSAFILAMRKIISNSTSNPCSVSQQAAITALDGEKAFLSERAERYRQRRDFLIESLSDIPELNVVPPQGAFYLYVDCRGLMGRQHAAFGTLNSDFDMVKALLNHHGLAVVHGDAFQSSPAFRISYAASEQALQQAVEKIHAFIQCLSPRGEETSA